MSGKHKELRLNTVIHRLEQLLARAEKNDFSSTREDRALQQAVDYIRESNPPNKPLEGFDYWDGHPDYPLANWMYEVANDDTRAGYWEWVRREQERKEE